MSEATAQEPGAGIAARAGQRAGDADRDRVVDALKVAAGDGRITPAEFDERVGAALTARTHGELAAVVSDLAADAPGAVSAAEPKDLVRINCHGSSARRTGRWVVPQRLEVRAWAGTVTLDFTEAVIAWPALRIDLDVNSGDLKLIVNPGTGVDTDDLDLVHSGLKVRGKQDPAVPVSFRIEVAGKAAMSSVSVHTPRQRRRRRLRRRSPLG